MHGLVLFYKGVPQSAQRLVHSKAGDYNLQLEKSIVQYQQLGI